MGEWWERATGGERARGFTRQNINLYVNGTKARGSRSAFWGGAGGGGHEASRGGLLR